MLKIFRDAGLVQIYIGSGLFFGFIITAYSNWMISVFVFSILILATLFSIIKSLAAETSKNPELDVKKAVIIITAFYSLIFGLFAISVIVGLVTGYFSK